MTTGRQLKAYYYLTKPGIVRGNAIAAAAGFFLAARGDVDFVLLAVMLAGLSGVIAAACICNNYMDRGIDRLMERTSRRGLVTGKVRPRDAFVLAAVLGLGGGALLWIGANPLSAVLAVIGFVAYVFLYGYAKRKTVHGTLVGTISGSAPPVVGYCAVSGRIDAAAIILFAILVFWQMPHFYAIAIYRMKDYAAASIPVLPIVRGMKATKVQILAYIAGYIVVAMLLTVFGYTGYGYLAITLGLGIWWLVVAYRGFRSMEPVSWSRGVFRCSLVVLSVQSLAIALGPVLP